MRIYEVTSAEGSELCHPVDRDDFERIDVQVNGEPRSASWEPIAMRIIKEDEGQRLTESDSPWLGSHSLIFRPRAIAGLDHLLPKHGELLPLLCNGPQVFIFNVTRVLDALDEKASEVMRFSSGRIMRIYRYAFRPEVIGNVDIFKIPNLRLSPTFVSQRFVDAWRVAGLKGLQFRQVWVPPN